MRGVHYRRLAAVLALCAAPACTADTTGGASDELQGGDRRDSLYIGDVADDTVKRFDARTGELEEVFVSSQSGGLFGPRGLIFDHRGRLLVVNQNVDQPFAGEVLRYDRQGDFRDALVPHTDPDAPYAPRGMVLTDHGLFVADMGEPGYVLAGLPAPNPFPARLVEFDARTGEWLDEVEYDGFEMQCEGTSCVQWSPRGVVEGPDGALYVSLQQFRSDADPNTLAGRVIRVDGDGDVSVLVDGEDGECNLARPEGLVFGPRGRLYVTSFRTSVEDNDKILVYDRRTGDCVDTIELDQPGGDRAFAQAIVFGPDGRLFVPISGNGPDTGSVRRYDVRTKEYDVFIDAGGALVAPFYATFGSTDPATLRYER